jgi:hypothetical protein
LKGCSKEQPFFMLRNWVEGEGLDDGFKLKGCSKEQPLLEKFEMSWQNINLPMKAV